MVRRVSTEFDKDWSLAGMFYADYRSGMKFNPEHMADHYASMRPVQSAQRYLMGQEIDKLLDEAGCEKLSELSTHFKIRVAAVYCCCFVLNEDRYKQYVSNFRDRTYYKRLKVLRKDALELTAQISKRIAELAAAKEKHQELLEETSQQKTDVEGLDLFEQVKRMGKDDWHELVCNWNWDNAREDVLQWIVQQDECDTGTALRLIFDSDLLDDAVWFKSPEGAHITSNPEVELIIEAVDRIRAGAYRTHEFAGFSDKKELAIFEKIRARVAAKDESLAISDECLAAPGSRQHAAKYHWSDGKIRYHPDYWSKQKSWRHFPILKYASARLRTILWYGR